MSPSLWLKTGERREGGTGSSSAVGTVRMLARAATYSTGGVHVRVPPLSLKKSFFLGDDEIMGKTWGTATDAEPGARGRANSDQTGN